MPRTASQYEEIRAEKKKYLLAVALELFAEQGYASTSISQIAQRAGISKGLLYNYFDSKEEVLEIIIKDFIDEMIRYVDPDRSNDISDDEMSGFIDICFTLFKERKEEMKLFYQLGLQRQVVGLMKKYDLQEADRHEKEMFVKFFRKKGFAQPYLTMLNFAITIKGFGYQYVCYPDLFSDELLTQYKEHLKDQFIRTNQQTLRDE